MATIQIEAGWDAVSIAEEAGQSDPEQLQITFGGTDYTLNVPGVDQSALDAALSNYIAIKDVVNLPEVKAVNKLLIDLEAGKSRGRHMTTIPGQAEVYQEKYDQAVEHAANSYPADLTSYPMILAEVNATGLTAQECSDNIITERSVWLATMADIEEERRKGKINVDAAADEAAAILAKDNAITALQGL